MRVFELADELGVRSIDVIVACADVGLADREAGSDLSEDEVKRVRFAFNQREAAEVMARSVPVERSSAPVLAPIHDPTAAVPPQGTPIPGPPPGAPPPGVAPGGPWGAPTSPSRAPLGMHPLIKKSILYFVLGQFVPCIGLFLWVYSVVLAGRGRRQVQWSGGRYSGDSAGLVIQILFWVELALGVVVFAVVLANGGATQPSP